VSGPTLLLVDDHRLLRQGLRRAVEDAGFDVVGEAGNGEEAVRLAIELRPDLVLMDVTMPVLDGIEATRRLRHSAPEARVVILTMHGEEDTIARALRAGAVAYLLKDCSTDQVAETLRAAAAGNTDLSADQARSLRRPPTRPPARSSASGRPKSSSCSPTAARRSRSVSGSSSAPRR
jgi:DNA-binding NarL/FixJ family response regulator